MSSALPVLTFHAIDERPEVISFPPRLFERAMAELHQSGYRTLDLADVAERLKRRAPLPQRSFVITFDDGYESVYGRAFPVLQRYGFSATVFLTVGENVERFDRSRLPSMCERPMLSWGEIKEMQRAGIAFGGHTLTHPDLTRVAPERITIEIVGGKKVIEDALGVPVLTFAYPFGRYDRRSREIASRHFACACSDKLGFTRQASDLYALERVDMYYLANERWLSLMPTRLFPWYVRARNIPRRLRRVVG
ncbi:MAG TPA: polysaccharide deacetylase family protein [Candidatus Eisenbacteria bacterium]|nr:polysaccharide deacetylase family protein [Candidatus Eisenbacteria bacterium]